MAYTRLVGAAIPTTTCINNIHYSNSTNFNYNNIYNFNSIFQISPFYSWTSSPSLPKLICKATGNYDEYNNLTAETAYSILGVQPGCSFPQLKAAFRAKVKEFHPDVRKDKDDTDVMIRRVIQAYEILSSYSKSEIIERECLDPFDNPECEAFDIFVNEVVCLGKGRSICSHTGVISPRKSCLICLSPFFQNVIVEIYGQFLFNFFSQFSSQERRHRPHTDLWGCFEVQVLCSNCGYICAGCPYSCVKQAPHAFTYSSMGTARAKSQGHGDDYQVQTAVGQCPRSCIHYVTPSQRIILKELLDSILETPWDTSAEAELLYSLIVKAKYENNRYQKPKKQPKSSTQHVDWF